MNGHLDGKTILVTGATGFIGGRLVEKICHQSDAKVRVLARDLSRLPRVGRFPVEIATGDVLNIAALDQAIEGCDIVFHCAYGNQGSRELRWKVNVEGTRNVARAAMRAHAERFVHVSTWAVYGHPPDGDLDESAPRRNSNYDYADSKLRAERIVFKYATKFGLPAVVIQPTVVYGPHAPAWTVHTLERLRSGRVILVNGGEGLCNAVYVDDVIEALLLAASQDKAVGEAFLISAEEPITWGRFFHEFEAMLGSSRTVSMTASEAIAFTREFDRKQYLAHQLVELLREEPQLLSRILRSREVAALATLARPTMRRTAMRMAKTLAGEGRDALTSVSSTNEEPIHPLDIWSIRRFESKVRVRIDKAKRLLGYKPAFTFDVGIQRTRQWARWANLVDGIPTSRWDTDRSTAGA